MITRRALSGSIHRLTPSRGGIEVACGTFDFGSRAFRSKKLKTRHFSTTTTEKLRIAIVGGGCAGLSVALHLAPLVDQGLVDPIDVYDAGHVPRDIGVGIWSTALTPFLASNEQSHHALYRDLISRGKWLGDVGYRTPNGAWLMKSHLPTSEAEMHDMQMPALLFLREQDLLVSLQTAVDEQGNLIRVHAATRVTGVDEHSRTSWSTQLQFNNNQLSEEDYHLIVAADGTHCALRRDYGGFDNVQRTIMGTKALASPNELPVKDAQTSSWDLSNQSEAVGIQDRNYTVFRGNSRLTLDDRTSFQTWGEGNSMRFATVPLVYPNESSHAPEERQVWFITIDDDVIAGEADATRRRDMLLDAFRKWHDPIQRIVEATPPEEILMERAIAHRHCMGPVVSMNKIIEFRTGKRPPSSGEGPCVVFTGDAYMTIDPILAQGFTVSMEGAAALRNSIEQSCVPFQQDPNYVFDPHELRKQLQKRHDARMNRLIHLLRATELVQALGQPSGASAAGILNTKLLRPITRMTPNFVKRPLFDAVLKYSLGV